MATESGQHAIDTMLLEERRYPPSEEFAAQANAKPGDLRRAVRGVLGAGGARAAHLVRAVRRRCTSGSRRTRSGTSAASSTSASTASTATSTRARATRSRTTGKASLRASGARSRTPTLQRDVVRFANALKKLGVKKGTPVAIYMGMVPELPVAMLACTRLGAPHTVVFGGFSADSLSGRMVDMECEVLITQDEAWRRGATVPLKNVADEAMERRRRRFVRRSSSAVPATTSRCRRARPLVARARAGRVSTIPRRARASRWTARTCSSSCTRAARPRSRRGSCIRPAAISAASQRRTTTSST